MPVCAFDGCPEPVPAGYCLAHAPKRRPAKSPSSFVTKTARWRRLKAAVLKRDAYVCQLGLDGCLHEATTVDHIEPVSAAPWLAYEPSNLRASCVPCNLRKGGRPA